MAEDAERGDARRIGARVRWFMRRLGQMVVAGGVAVAGIGFAWVVGLNIVIAAVLAAAILIVAGLAQILWERRPGKQGSTLTFVVHTLAAAVVVAAGIQMVPAGRSHSNPAVTGEPQWADPQARELMVRACFGCHSNEVEWPWYANVAPLSWAISDHVAEGREAVNYSEFDRPQEEAGETIEVLLDGSMPPAYYTRFGLHPEADLSAGEVDALVAWLRQTPGLAEEDGESEGDDEDRDEREEDDDDD